MKIVSFHNGNIDPEIIKYQRLVFEHFGYEIEQVQTSLPHGEAIDEYLRKPFDKIAIFDIDCVPLTEHFFEGFLRERLYGVAQQANHIPGSGVYASPACIGFSEKYYNAIGRPSFLPDKNGDVGYKVTEAVEAYQRVTDESWVPQIWWPIHVEVPKWDLGENSTFGLGTTYGYIHRQGMLQPYIYHAFESRMGNGGMFVRKCKEVLNGK